MFHAWHVAHKHADKYLLCVLADEFNKYTQSETAVRLHFAVRGLQSQQYVVISFNGSECDNVLMLMHQIKSIHAYGYL